MEEHKDKIHLARLRGREPYFLRDNTEKVDKILTIEKPEQYIQPSLFDIMEEAKTEPTLSTLEKARLRHEARTPEQIAEIQRRADERQERLLSENRTRVLQIAEKRHRNRTIQKEDELKIFAWKREIAHHYPDMKDNEVETMARNWLILEREFKGKNPNFKKGKMMDNRDADQQKSNPKFVPKFIRQFVTPKTHIVERAGVYAVKNPNYKKSLHEQYAINCATCVPAFMLRKWGFNVTANGRVENSGSINDKAARNAYDMWKNMDGTRATPTSYIEWLSKQQKVPNNTMEGYKRFILDQCEKDGIYAAVVKWKKNKGAHITVLIKQKGHLMQIEPQAFDGAYGIYREIDYLADRVNVYGQWGDFTKVLRIDDKLFDGLWTGLFSI